jgi:predicted histone-like DNA-binding protein
MKYKAMKRVNPQDRSVSKWYPAPVNEGAVSQKAVAADIVQLSSLSRGDISNVIESLIDTVPKYLLMGKSVKLGDLGSLRITFSGEGAATEEEVVASNIKGVRVLFTPSVALRDAIKNISFEKTV